MCVESPAPDPMCLDDYIYIPCVLGMCVENKNMPWPMQWCGPQRDREVWNFLRLGVLKLEVQKFGIEILKFEITKV